MKIIVLEGKVVSGQGNGRRYLQLPWVKNQIEEKLGFDPYLGTLNLKLSPDSVHRKRLLDKAKAIEICPAESYCVGLVYKAIIAGVECAAVIPSVEGYPEDALEVIAPIYLREALSLKDGSVAIVTVMV